MSWKRFARNCIQSIYHGLSLCSRCVADLHLNWGVARPTNHSASRPRPHLQDQSGITATPVPEYTSQQQSDKGATVPQYTSQQQSGTGATVPQYTSQQQSATGAAVPQYTSQQQSATAATGPQYNKSTTGFVSRGSNNSFVKELVWLSLLTRAEHVVLVQPTASKCNMAV